MFCRQIFGTSIHVGMEERDMSIILMIAIVEGGREGGREREREREK